MRKDYCEKDGISITYSDDNVCFEDVNTAEAIVFSNDGTVPINNFDEARTQAFKDWYDRIYPTILYFRSLDRLEV